MIELSYDKMYADYKPNKLLYNNNTEIIILKGQSIIRNT